MKNLSTYGLLVAHVCLLLNTYIIKDQSKRLKEGKFEMTMWNTEIALWISLIVVDIANLIV